MNIEIRQAKASDAQRLTAIAFAAKRHWGYSDELIKLWKGELTVTSIYVASHRVFSASINDKVVGFCALSQEDSCYWLDHMWVLPDYIGGGIGRRLLVHALRQLNALREGRLSVISDPNAEGFYLKMGFRRVGECGSKPKGRTLPVLELKLAAGRAFT